MILLRQESLFILSPELFLKDLYIDFKHNIKKVKTKLLLSFLSFYLSASNSFLNNKAIKLEKMLDTNNIKEMNSLNLDREYNLLYKLQGLYEDYEILKRNKGKNKNFDKILVKLDTLLDHLSKNINYLGYIESKLLMA